MPAARNPLTLAVLVSVWLAAVANWPLWRALAELPELSSTRGMLFMSSLGVMIAGLSLTVLSLGAWRGSIRPLSALLLLAAAIGAHFMGSYGIVIDPTMMVNVLHTNVHEARDLIDAPLLRSLLLMAGLPLWLLWRTPVRALPFKVQGLRNVLALLAGVALAGGFLVLNFGAMASTMRNHKSLRYMVNPANSLYALGHVTLAKGSRRAGGLEAIGADVHVLPRRGGARPPLLLLVVGETARADHFALNGYARNTNPELSRLELVNFSHVSSCGTNTATSLPCMFSSLGREAFGSRTRDQENLLDLLQQAGLAVLWLENQGGCKGLCERVPHADAIDAPSGSVHPAGLCQGGECLDEALLTGLDQRLAALPEERRQRGVVLVMHQMGSHGPAYYKRSAPSAKPFRPECMTHALQDCEHQSLVNAYDNSIAYTDRVLSRAIAWLGWQAQVFDPMLLYVSDHGESLGERNIYLHGLPYSIAPKEQTHVPMLLWLPPQTEAAIGVTRACLGAQRDAELSHDHLFHTVLGLLGVASASHKASLDLTAPCRGV